MAEVDEQTEIPLDGSAPEVDEGSAPEVDDAAVAASEGGGGLEALRSELEAIRAENARLHGRLDEQGREAGRAAAEPPREYTRAELQEQVDSGRISEDQRDEVLDRQRTRRLKEEIRAEVREEERQRRLTGQVNELYARHPTALQEGHPDRVRAGQKYRELVDLGYPAGAVAELAALKDCFGPETARPREKTRELRERHQEVAGGSAGGGEGGAPSWQKGLSPRLITHYQRMLDKGAFRGADDPAFQAEVRIARGEDPWKATRRKGGQPGERRVQ